MAQISDGRPLKWLPARRRYHPLRPHSTTSSLGLPHHCRPSPSPTSSEKHGRTHRAITITPLSALPGSVSSPARHRRQRWCCPQRMAWVAERLLYYTLCTHIAIFLLRLSSQTMFISIRKWLVLAACLTGHFCVHGNERGGVGSGIRGGTGAASAGSNGGEVRIIPMISRILLCCVKPIKSSLLAVSLHQKQEVGADIVPRSRPGSHFKERPFQGQKCGGGVSHYSSQLSRRAMTTRTS